MHQNSTTPSDEVTLNRCQDLPPVPVLTTVAPVGAQETLYVATSGQLSAINASDGTVRWCQQVTRTTREYSYHPRMSHPRMSHPPPRRILFGTPRVVNGVVYVCASGYGNFTYAFNAADGTLRWRTPTDARIVSMGLADFAVPVVRDTIVYSSTYALNERDGTVLWRVALETYWLSPHVLVEDTMYALGEMGVCAINAHNGEVSWLYQPDAHTSISGPLVVADHLLYVGTSGSVDHPDKSYFCALNAENGTVRWKYPIRHFIGAVIHNESVYVSSGDGFLSALEKNNGRLRWNRQFVSSGHYPATIAESVLYLNTDGAYALRSGDGAILWHQHLGSSPGVSFTPSVVLDEVVYLASIDGRGQSILYALNASSGTEYWHSHYPSQIYPLATAR